jgi:hypothetical protein
MKNMRKHIDSLQTPRDRLEALAQLEKVCRINHSFSKGCLLWIRQLTRPKPQRSISMELLLSMFQFWRTNTAAIIDFNLRNIEAEILIKSVEYIV